MRYVCFLQNIVTGSHSISPKFLANPSDSQIFSGIPQPCSISPSKFSVYIRMNSSTTGGTKAEAVVTSIASPEYSSSGVKKARLESTLKALLSDPILADVPKNPSLSDVDTLINLELGSAMRITVLKLDGTSFEVVVLSSATVKDLKLAIKKKMNAMEESRMGHRHISWRHVWTNFCLSYHNEKLLDDNTTLQDYGVRNNSQVQFIPYVVLRVSGKHSRRRKHRFFHGLNRKA